MTKFMASFNGKQLTALTELFNDFRIFIPEVVEQTVIALFSCKLKAPLTVHNTRTLCYIFHCMSLEFLITPIWQAVAEQHACFVSLKGKSISRNTLSSAKYCAVKSEIIDSWTIEEYISRLKRLK